MGLISEFVGSIIMIFVRTCNSTKKVATILNNIGYNTIFINGQMTQEKRLTTLQKFKLKESSIIVATDIASRGLDITVDLIINYDTPINPKTYVHRVGRTARAGRFGRAVTLVTQYDIEIFQKIEQLIGKKMDEYPYEEKTLVNIVRLVGEAQRYANFENRDNKNKKRSK